LSLLTHLFTRGNFFFKKENTHTNTHKHTNTHTNTHKHTNTHTHTHTHTQTHTPTHRLVAYSALLGPVAGIMLCDFYLTEKRTLFVDELYVKEDSRYWYKGGVNFIAIFAFLVGVIPNIPGFFLQVGAATTETVPPFFESLYHAAWFLGSFLSGVSYYFGMKFFHAVKQKMIFELPASYEKAQKQEFKDNENGLVTLENE